MSRYWRNRHKLWDAFKEIGCGLLTVLLFTLPLWVMTVSWRGPVFALTSLLVLGVALLAIILTSRFFRRR
jgi:hypothetical protein